MMFSNPQSNISALGIDIGMKVADLGAGSGFYAIESAKRVGPRGMVYAIDVQQDLLDKIKNGAGILGLHNVEVIWGNIEKIGGTKLRESLVDRVIISNVLFQVEQKDLDNIVLEIKRILKSGGKVLVTDWESRSDISPEKTISSSVVQGLFEKLGFKLENKFDAGDHHYGIIFKKQ